MRVRFLAALAAVAAAAFVAAGSAGAASNHICNNDVLGPGDYLNVSVTGFCNLNTFGAHIHGSLFVQGGSSFNGATGGFLIVDGGISVSASGVLVLDGFGNTDNMRILHGISADRPNSVVLHSIFIAAGGVQVQGGGGNKVGSCERSDVPLTGVPYINLEDSFLGGNLTWNGYHGCWDGFFRNAIVGSVTL